MSFSLGAGFHSSNVFDSGFTGFCYYFAQAVDQTKVRKWTLGPKLECLNATTA